MRVLDHPAFQILLLSAVLLLMASPTLWPQPRYDFPFSAYAMFSTRQDERTAVTHAVAVFDGGREVPLEPRFFGTDEVLQAKVTLINTQKRGKRAQMELCWDLAKQVNADPEFAGAKAVEMRTVTYDTLKYFEDPSAAIQKKTVHAHCKVDR